MRYKTLSSRDALKAFALFAGIVPVISLGTVGSARATSIGLDLGGAPRITATVANSFDTKRFTPCRTFSHSISHFPTANLCGCSQLPNNPLFEGLLTLQTNSPVTLDPLKFAGTGFLVDQHGNPLQSPQQLGIASKDNLLGAGLLPLLPGDLQRPLDFFGIHFDLTLPLDQFVSITGEQFSLLSDRNHPFGIGPGVPIDIVSDQGSTLLLLSIGLLWLVRRRQRLVRQVRTKSFWPWRRQYRGGPVARGIFFGSNAYDSFRTDRLMTLPRNLATAFLQSSERFADNAALSVGGQERSYEDLERRAKSFAATVRRESPAAEVPLTAVFWLSVANRVCGSPRSAPGGSRLCPA